MIEKIKKYIIEIYRLKKNIKFDCLNSDPYLICLYKKIRIHFNLIKMIIIIFILSLIFSIYIEPIITDNLFFKTLLMTLNVITFIGVFHPVSIQKNLTKKDIIDISEKKKEDDEINKRTKERATL